MRPADCSLIAEHTVGLEPYLRLAGVASCLLLLILDVPLVG
jgi:hypothetical protein